MRLATIRTPGGTRAARIEGDIAILLEQPDLNALLDLPDWKSRAATSEGDHLPLAGIDYAPLVPRPGKIICVGLNYRSHILEMGREIPQYPSLFAKYTESLIGPDDPIVLPMESDQIDWEVELAIVIGTKVRRAGDDEARAAIAGFTVLNDVSARDYQFRSPQWLQGKTFEAMTPVGPWLVTPDELKDPSGMDLRVSCAIDGETVQSETTAELVHGPIGLVAYISRILTLNPGDLIATGTPGGVGIAFDPPRFLKAGETVVTAIEGLGQQTNRIVAAP